MKLTKIFESVKTAFEPEVLSEAIKFGNREMATVHQEKNDILVGIEYEFYVNEYTYAEEVVDEAVITERAYEICAEKIEEDINYKEEQFLEEYANGEMSEWLVREMTSNLYKIKTQYEKWSGEIESIVDTEDEFKEILDEIDPDDIEKTKELLDDSSRMDVIHTMLDNMEMINGAIKTIKDEMKELDSEKLEFWIGYIDGHHNIPNNLSDALNAIESYNSYVRDINTYSFIDILKNPTKMLFDEDVKKVAESLVVMRGDFEYLYEIKDWLEEVAETSDHSDGEWDSIIHHEFREHGVDLWDSDKETYIGYDPDNYYESPFWDEAEQEAREENEPEYKSSIEDFVGDKLADNGMYDRVERVYKDGSLDDNGVEVVSKPLALDDAMNFMNEMFEFIDEIGYTNNDCGMHVNMSLRGVKLNFNTFNPLKMYTLLGEDYVLNKYRGGYSSYAKKAEAELSSLVMWYISKYKNMNAVLESLNRRLKVNVKYSTANLSHLYMDDFETTKVGGKERIEFRYFGGEGYQDDFEDMKKHIYRNAYVLMAAYVDGFLHKEYIESAVRYIDRITMEHYKMSFAQLQKYYELYDGDYDRFKAEVLEGKSKTLSSFKKKI